MKPVLFEIGKFKVFSYGLMLVTAFFTFLFFVYKQAPKRGLNQENIMDLTISTFISGIFGARIIYVLVNISSYIKDPKQIFQFQKGGLAWHGGLIGAFLCILIFTKIKKMPLWQTMDLMFTASILGLAVGRIGCFLNGCCYGKPCNLPWAVTFPYHHHPVPVHPTQIYELILDLIVFIFLLYWWKKRKFFGENTLMLFITYSGVRFFVEFFRNTSPNQMINGLSLAQWVSLGTIIIISIPLIFLRIKTPNRGEIDKILINTQKEENNDITHKDNSVHTINDKL